jgi:hypothetical protein
MVQDFDKELRGDDEAMNVKGGDMQASILSGVLVGLVVAAGSIGISRAVDSRDETTTAASIATLTERVSALSTQVSKLTEQPYVRREEYLGVLGGIENRLSGIEQRIGNVERAALERRQRER